MGVKELWTVLSPVSEKKSLWELKDKSIAVDLSAWICDSQNVGDNSQRNMYLRNLFFRTAFLLLLGAKPIFVLEGSAPELKHATIVARSQARNGKNVPKSSSRSQLRALQKQCEKFLKTLGVPCVQSGGEAEAYCAWLNEIGIVDAVITQDSDSLLYGARIVYRNFTMSPSYTCEAYDMSVIEEKLQLGRQKLLAVSLLCGSDYNKGVNGVGKESTLKFLSSLDENKVLDRLKSWSNDPLKYEILEKKGNTRLMSEQKLELSIRKKALLIPGFPSEDIINEYLSPKSGASIPMIGWLQPDLPTFLKIADHQLGWEEEYAIEKFLPLVTRWHLLNPCIKSFVKCESILKKRTVRGINCYECKWTAEDLMLGENITLTTAEPQDLVAKCYESMVQEFVASKTKPKKATKKTRKKKNDEDNILRDMTNTETLLLNLSLEDKTEKHANKKRIKNKTKNGLQTLDKFVTIGKNEINAVNVMHSTPKRNFCNLKNNYEENELNTSIHYISDASPSPLRCRKRTSLNLKSCQKHVSDSVDVTARWSLTDYVGSSNAKDNKTINSNKLNKNQIIPQTDISMTASFLNISNEDYDFNMSDIVDSIINSENVNPAVNMLLDLKKQNKKF